MFACNHVSVSVAQLLFHVFFFFFHHIFQQFPFQRKTSKPLLCSINGLCKSIGFEIALLCDIRYAEEKALFGFSNRQLGIPLLNDGPKRLSKLIGLSKAIEFLVLDRQINSQEAADLGIVTAVVQDGTGTLNTH